jgi:hypothetical protein
VYSVGGDKKDDGGQAPVDPSSDASRWNLPDKPAVKGDWILYSASSADGRD